jgi:hypothetical protein
MVPWTVAVDWANAEEVARRAATSTIRIAIFLLSMLPPKMGTVKGVKTS